MKKIILNISSLILLGLIMQKGGAYIVNAAVNYLEEAQSLSAAADMAKNYSAYMETMRAIEPRQFVHIMFVAPLVEEIVFRLIFLRASKMIMPFWAANLVQSTLFAIYHTVAMQRIYAFILGLMIGCVFHYCPMIYKNSKKEKKGGLHDMPDCLIGTGITFILHVVINSAGLLLAPHLPADIRYSLQFAVGSVLLVIAAAVCVLLSYQTKRLLYQCPSQQEAP